MQLKVNQMIQDKRGVVSRKEDARAKAVAKMKVLKGKGKQSTLGRPRTRSSKIALELQSEVSPPKEQIMVDDLIIREINEDRVYWLDKINGHLEKLLKKEKMANNFPRHMVMHDYTINKVSQVRVKHLKSKLNENLTGQMEKGKLNLLSQASLVA